MKKGFTLIELLIVIAIVAVLATVVIITLNPAELLRESRDANRISDIATLRTAIALYVVDVTGANIASSSQGYGGCYISAIGANATTSSNCGYFNGGYSLTTVSSTAALYKNTDGTGWLPVNFQKISSGAPFGVLPVDPTNNQNNFYSYAATSTQFFELETSFESKKYAPIEANDGGNNTSTYEAGSTYVF